MEGFGGLILVGILVALAIGSLLYLILGNKIASEKRMDQRLRSLDSEAEKRRKKRELERKSSAARESMRERLKNVEDNQGNADASLELLLLRAGSRQTASSFRLIFIVIAAAVGLLTFVASGDILYAALSGIPVALLLPKKIAKGMVARREKKFLTQFPQAIDIMVRGVKSGMPVAESLKVIAREIPEPVAGEFRLIVDSTAVGMSLEESLDRFYGRMNLPEVNFFRTVLIIQKQTGGNLAEALSNLSNILRERKKLQDKVKALSAEAKASAKIIGSLPFVVGSLLYMIAPDYILLLFTHPTGHIALVGCAIWMGMGVLIMRNMINFQV